MAVQAARAELDRRGIDKAEFEYLNHIAELERDSDVSRAEEPLSMLGRIYFVLFALVMIVTIPATILLYSQGYKRKARDAWIFTASSPFFYWAIFGGMFLAALLLG